MENKDINQYELYIRIMFQIYCFQKEIKEKNNSDYETPKNSKSSEYSIFYIKNSVMKKFKKLLDYKTFCTIIEKSKIVMLKEDGYFTYKNAYYDTILNDLFKYLEKFPDYINKIKRLNKNEIKEKLIEKDKKSWKNKYVELQKGNKKEEKIELINEFEIINEDIYNLYFKNQNYDILKGNYFFGGNKMIILIINKNESKCLIGNIKNDGFKSKYLIDINSIDNIRLTEFLDDLIKFGIKNILNEINKKKNKEINKISIEGKSIDIYEIKDNLLNSLTFKGKNIIFGKEKDKYISNKPNDNNINIENSDKKDDFENILSGKIKTLILLSLFQLKIHDNNEQKLFKVFLVKRKSLEFQHFKKINELIKSNNKILNTIKNININDLSFDYIDKNIIKDLDENELKYIEQIISGNKEIRDTFKKFLSYEFITEEVNLLNSRKIKIFMNFSVIHEKLLKDFEQNFSFKKMEPNFSYIFVNKKDILIDHKQSLIFIISSINEDYEYNIDYILDINEFKNFNFINDLQKLEYENYINDKEVNDYISPIFLEDNIQGNCYKYKSEIKDYNNIRNYSKYLKNKTLKNLISLYCNYQKINLKLKLKNKNQFEKYYLINHDFINEIKNNNGYKLIYDSLQKKIDNINISEKDNKNLYYLLKCLPVDLLEQYKDRKIDNIKESMIINLNIEPFIKTINNYENNKQDEPLLIYDNFEIIEQKILKYYVDNYKNENLLSECIFIDEKIIVNLPNYLNKNKYISLIGCMDEYYNNFILDYILIYNNENDRKIHIQNINQNFNLFLNEIKFSDKFKQINYNNISLIIIKYEKDSNDNNNNDRLINKNKLIENFKSCPKIGLQNIGATCYMNATLQCFSHIEQFVEYFKYNTILTEIVGNNKNLLSTSFKILIDELWPDNFDPSSPNLKKYYSPEDFKSKISKMNPLFEGIAANDSKDLVNFIIMTLHLELNKVNIINKENNNNGIVDQTNKQLIYINFFKEIHETNNSIISQLFYAINCNVTRCLKCNYQIFNCQVYFFIIFPLEEVRKFKSNIINQQNMINNMNNQINNMNIHNPYNMYMMNGQYQFNNNINYINVNGVNIYDCFEYDRKINYMTGDNSMYCNFCKSQQECYMSTNLVTGPEVLIILLNRGNGIEFNVKIEFYENLNLYNYIEFKNTGFNYRLIGVISHLGESGMGGHFIAYCRDPLIINKWYKYNDAIVDEVKDFKKEIIDFAMPYLLFYQKIKADNK